MKRLKLNKETIRVLTPDLLRAAVGGAQAQPVPDGFIMQDSVIVPTGFIMKDSVIVRTSSR